MLKKIWAGNQKGTSRIMQEHYYVCYYDTNKEHMIAAGPHTFIDKDDYPPEEGFFNQNEAELAMLALKKNYPGIKAFIVKKVN